MQITRKLAILADAAKYDASCASSGAGGRNSLKSGGIGSTEGMGICHSYTPDGRCVSLLKILLTNFCIYDCAYCVNRVSSNVPRARFAVDLYTYRIGRELGSLAAAAQGVDAIVFTAGIGEHAASIRERVCRDAA